MLKKDAWTTQIFFKAKYTLTLNISNKKFLYSFTLKHENIEKNYN